MNVVHTCIWVSDLERTSAFYEDALGLTHTHDFESDGVTNYYVGGDSGMEIQFKYDSDATDAVEPSGVDHVAVEVEDCDATIERMVEETGCEVVRDPGDNDAGTLRFGFIRDPDGYVVEILTRGA